MTSLPLASFPNLTSSPAKEFGLQQEMKEIKDQSNQFDAYGQDFQCECVLGFHIPLLPLSLKSSILYCSSYSEFGYDPFKDITCW